MASTARYISGDSKPRIFKASASYPFEKSDLLYMHPADGTLRRSSDMNAQGSADLGQLGFAQYFVGVAGVKNGLESGEVSFKPNQNFESEVLVHTGGVWEFECASTTWKGGDDVGIYANSGGSCPSPQKVATLASPYATEQRIGSAVLTAGALKAGAMTRVCVEIQPAYLAGGVPSDGTYSGTSGQ